MTVPEIPAILSDEMRPLWSVMIPTYQPDVTMLREAMAGPLAAHDRSAMQIALVDDASGPDWDAPLAALAGECTDRGIELHRFAANAGVAGNWNRCLELSRGCYIHVLHQDDRVHPEFYEAIAAGFSAQPRVGAAFTQHAFFNNADGWLRNGLMQSKAAGIVDDWLEYVLANLAIQCSSIVVRRGVYERLGGFDTSYRYCCDRDMWQRIALEYPLWFDPRPLSEFRFHPGNESAKLRRQSASWREVNRCVKSAVSKISPPARHSTMRSFRRHTLRWAASEAREAIRERDWRGAFAILRGAASIAQARDICALVIGQYDAAPPGRAPDRSLDDSAPRRPRVLLLADCVPWNPVYAVTGAVQRLSRHLVALSSIGSVDVALFRSEDRPWSEAEIDWITPNTDRVWPEKRSIRFVAAGKPKGFFAKLCDAFWSLHGYVGFLHDAPSMTICRRRQVVSVERLLQTCQPDIVFTSRLNTAVSLLRVATACPPIVVDFVDIESVRLERLAMSRPELFGRLKARFAALLARKAERRVVRLATTVLVCSELERQKVQLRYPGAHVLEVPNGAPTFGVLTPPASRPVAVFVGTAWYEPNCEAIRWFAKDIWPLIREAIPDARFVVAGEKTEELGIASPDLGIEVLGFVEDLAPIYEEALLAVCPIRRGSGTRIKIIEASANGRPVVSTTVGAEGLTFVPGAEIVIEDDVKDFADACVALMRDPQRAEAIGQAAAQRARSAYDQPRIIEQTCSIIMDMLRAGEEAASPFRGQPVPVAVVEGGKAI